MSNAIGNVALKSKQKKKKRKRQVPVPQSNPQATTPVIVSPMTKIAALFQLQQQLAKRNKKSGQDSPLMSGPRFSPQMKWHNKKFYNSRTRQVRLPTPQSNQETSNNQQNVNQSENPPDASIFQNTMSQNTIQLSEAGPSQSSNNAGSSKYFSSFNINKRNSNQNMNLKFHDCEVYDSPSFINFETDDAGTDLNDDEIGNKIAPNVGSIKLNIQDSNTGFETKLQEQHTIPKQNIMTQVSEETNVLKEQLPQNDDKPANENNIKSALSETNVDVKEKTNTNVCTLETHKIVQDNKPSNDNNIMSELSETNIDVTEKTDTNVCKPETHQIVQEPIINKQTIIHSFDHPMFIKTDNANVSQIYSPTDLYLEGIGKEESPENDSAFRTSAFQRLGPPEKKPRLTINVTNREHSIREVVDETEKMLPIHEKRSILESKDNTVHTFLKYWPWTKNFVTKKTVTFRSSKTVMMMEKEYMKEIYEKDSIFFMVTLEGYPVNWTKEDVLDLILEHLKGKHFVPCFIEFTPKECKFLIIRSKAALLTIHSLGFIIHSNDIEVKISVSQTVLNLRKIDFVPRIVLRSRLAMGHDGESKLDLSEFTLKPDISNFIYFPLNRNFNQTELLHLQSSVSLQLITELNLSHNRIRSIEGFRLENTTPKLKVLDLSNNCIESVLVLLPIKELHLVKLTLEGNPLCCDYIDSDEYVKVLKTIFSSLREIDGVQIAHDSVPKTIQNYCPENCKPIVEKFLEINFPLLECGPNERRFIQSMYDYDALFTVTHKSQLRYNTNKQILNLITKSRSILDGDFDYTYGNSNIVKLLKKWPNIQYDPTTFTVDVIYSTDTIIIFTINGIVKITAETLAENESLLSFTRTVTLCTKNGYEYKISNEMVYYDEPYPEWEKRAFQIVSIPKKAPFLKFDSPPDEDTKARLIYIFMKMTNVEKKQCESYLVEKEWNFKDALELFTRVIKSSNIQTIQ